MFTVRQMRYFDALATELHFRKAAESVHISQPALSVQIADMEKLIGTPLFERTRKSILLTEMGKKLLPRIHIILQEIRALEEIASQKHGILQSHIRLGIIPTIAPYLLPELIPVIRKEYPDLQLELREAMTDRLLDDLQRGQLDAIIAALPVNDPAFSHQHLFSDRFMIAMSANNRDILTSPLSQDDAALERLLLLEEGHCLRDQALEVCSISRKRELVNFGATSMSTLLQMVSHDMGLTLIPEIAIRTEMRHARIRIVPFAGSEPKREIALLWRRQSERVQDFNALSAAIAQAAEPLLLSAKELDKLYQQA